MEYNQQMLHRLQQLELGILRDFMKACDDHGLTWWAFGGTGIGALRHQGFVPWDDDIDVCLPRKDYETLLSVMEQEYGEKYLVINADSYPDYPLPTTRITLRDSVFVEESLKKVKNVPLGIFLDVYAFDHVAEDSRQAGRQAWMTWLYGKLMILSSVPFPVLPFRGFRAKLVHACTACCWALLRLFRVSPGRLHQRLKKTAGRYNDRPAKEYAYFNDTNPFSNTYAEEELFPLRDLPFEGLTLHFPRELEKTLRVLYGDFMQLPPEEKRKNHFPSRLKFPGEDRIYSSEESSAR